MIQITFQKLQKMLPNLLKAFQKLLKAFQNLLKMFREMTTGMSPTPTSSTTNTHAMRTCRHPKHSSFG